MKAWLNGRDLSAVDYHQKPHRRSGKRQAHRLSRAAFKPDQWGVWLGLFLLSVIWWLPVAWRDALASGIGRVHYRFGRGHYRAARRNIRLCFPQKSAEDIDTLLHEHSQTQWCIWFDLPALWLRPIAALRRRTDLSGLDILQARAQDEVPTVLLVCHNAALEHAAQVLKSVLPMLGYYRRFKSPVLEWLFYTLRSRNGGYLAERENTLHGLIRDMRGGWQLYQMIDEDMGEAAGTYAKLFDTEMCAVDSVARMCRLAGAGAVPVYSGYNRARHRYEIKVFEELADFPSGSRIRDAQSVMTSLEALICECPSQFMWRQRMLHTQRGGAPSPYLNIREAED